MSRFNHNSVSQVKIYIDGSWVSPRDYQLLTFNDFKQNRYTEHNYMSSTAVSSIMKVDENTSRFHADYNRIDFKMVKGNGNMVYMVRDTYDYVPITDDPSLFTSDPLKSGAVALGEMSQMRGYPAADNIKYSTPKSQSDNWFKKTFGFEEKHYMEYQENRRRSSSTEASTLSRFSRNVQRSSTAAASPSSSTLDFRVGVTGKTCFSKFTPTLLTSPVPILKITFSDPNSHLVKETRRFHIGHFGTPTLSEIREFAQTFPKSQTQSTLVSKVLGDVFNHHTNPEFNGALFQVASQFNCLEFPSPEVTPEHGITDYVYDRTQGPACTVPTGPATFYRNYLAPVAENKIDESMVLSPGAKLGQSADNQIDNLADVIAMIASYAPHISSPLVDVKNGYAFSTVEKLNLVNEILGSLRDSQLDELADRLRIGLQFKIGAYLNANRKPVSPSELQLVSHAFCSVISIAYSGISTHHWEKLAKVVLRASYEATFWAAVINKNNGGSNKLVLTLVGGGVFGNKRSWIMDAIRCAHDKTKEYGLDVIIGYYSDAMMNSSD